MTEYKIIIKKPAEKFIEKQPAKQQKRIIDAIMRLPYEGDIDTYKAHEGYFRLRVGSYRILYTVSHKQLIVTVANADNRGQVYKYAIANDITDRNYAEYVHMTASEPESKRLPFTEDEITQLRVSALPYADIILILIYTGWRIGELLAMDCSDINTAEWTMKGGAKTEAGKNRIVPVHESIKPYITKYINGRETGKLLPGMTYGKFSGIFKEVCARLGTPHTIHDTRHTFATRADNFGMNKVCIQRLMGHASRDVTDKVYTHKDLEQLRKAIDLLP